MAHGIKLNASNNAPELEQAQVTRLEHAMHRILLSKPVEFSEVNARNIYAFAHTHNQIGIHAHAHKHTSLAEVPRFEHAMHHILLSHACVLTHTHSRAHTRKHTSSNSGSRLSK